LTDKKEENQDSKQELEQAQPRLKMLPSAKNWLDQALSGNNPDLWKILVAFIPEDMTPDNPRNLFLLTEWPNSKYTKEVTKLETWHSTVKHALGYDAVPVKHMDFFFARSMVSHRRGREKNMLQALRGNDQTIVTQNEKSRVRRLFG